MELDHLHVAQRQAKAQRHGEAIHALVTGRGVVAIHGWSATGCQQHRLCGDKAEGSRANVDEQNSGQGLAVERWNECDGAMFFKALDRQCPYLLHQPVDDLDASEVALVHGAIEGLAGKGLAVQRAIRVAIKKTADLVFELLHALDGLADERPCHVLMGEPLAALDGVHEMALDGVAWIEGDVVAALDHAGAAAFAE